MERERAAVGIALHTAWVAVVALMASNGGVELIYRGRLDLVSERLPQQAYHAAAEGGLTLAGAQDLIGRWRDGATANAREGLRQVAVAVSSAGGELHACALFGERRLLPSLERVLSSHPLLHAAEGQLARDVAAAAAEAEGLHVMHVSPEEGVDAAITAAIASIGRAAGPPWAADQRHAATAAWVALNVEPARPRQGC